MHRSSVCQTWAEHLNMLLASTADMFCTATLQAHYRDYGQMTYARSVFVIHNVAHQGRGPMAELGPLEIPPQYTESFRLYDPIGGEHMNIMKAAFQHAHRIVAVSHGCARTPLC